MVANKKTAQELVSRETLDIEKHEDRWIIKVEKDHTLFNLIRRALWEIGAEAGYDKGHPYTGKATLVIRDKDPEKALNRAIIKVRNDLKELKVHVSKVKS